VTEAPEITNKRQWHVYLKAARLKNEELRESRFAWTVVSAISGRLDGMEKVVESGRAPTLHDRERGMGLGVIAIRSIYAVAPDYCRLLLELTHGFDRWPTLPDV
jgi:hypothetical protein